MLLEAEEKTSSTKHPNVILFIPLILELSEYGSVLGGETTWIHGPRPRPARRRQREGQLWDASVIVLDLAGSERFDQERGKGVLWLNTSQAPATSTMPSKVVLEIGGEQGLRNCEARGANDKLLISDSSLEAKSRRDASAISSLRKPWPDSKKSVRAPRADSLLDEDGHYPCPHSL